MPPISGHILTVYVFSVMALAVTVIYEFGTEVHQGVQYDNGLYHNHHRYWKVIEISSTPSSAAQLFFDAMKKVPKEEPRSQFTFTHIFPLTNCNIAHPTEKRKITAREQKAFLEYLANAHENGAPVDPISWEILERKAMWSMDMIAVGKYVLEINGLIQSIWNKGLRNDGKIPHPLWDTAMSPEEEEKFVADLSVVMCVSKEQIRECWKLDDKLLSEWAWEVLTKRSPDWKTKTIAGQMITLEQEKNRLHWRLPFRRFTLIPTYQSLTGTSNIKC